MRPPVRRDPPGVPARAAAVRLLHGVLIGGRPLEAGMDAVLTGLTPPDRGLATALARAALRWLVDLDAAIDGATARPIPPDARARAVLRVALAGAWALGTPAHAAVATALPLVEGGPRRLVHGVLSGLLKRPLPLLAAPTLPSPWRERWARAWPGADIAAALAGEPALDLGLRDWTATEGWAERLGGVSLAPGHVRVTRPGAVAALPGFDEGAWWVQDLAASLPARALDPRPGERVLDLCAAPGGKTMQLAAMGAKVTALDLSATRMARLGENLARTGLAAELVIADALDWRPAAPFDAVLLDAPCSATGTARRHPDVLYLKAGLDLGPALALQRALLARALGWVRPGGRLVYAVCSTEPEEGEDVVAALLGARAGVRHPRLGAPPAGLPERGPGWRTLPSDLVGGIDAFHVARLDIA